MFDERPIANPTRTKEILQKYGFSFKKSLGQNFITEINILEKIVATAELSEEDAVIEVGPGIGALTEQIAKAAGEVLAFEIDDRLLPVLDDTLSQYENIKILHQDVLKADLEEIASKEISQPMHLKVVANLPYYITTPIMMRFLESHLEMDSMVLMMQKEVADRLSAKPNTKAYGSLSIAVQYVMNVETAFIVPKTVFVPQPNVDSAIVKLTRKTESIIKVKNETYFFKVVRAAFAQRRKTLWNNLLSLFGKSSDVREKLLSVFEEINIDEKRRGETLTIEEFTILSNALYEILPMSDV